MWNKKGISYVTTLRVALQHTPSTLGVGESLETECTSVTFDCRTRQRLGENVGDHVVGRKEMNFDLASLDNVPNPMPLDVDVLHATVMFRVLEHSEGGLVVDQKL